jgi:hypothetical protein
MSNRVRDARRHVATLRKALLQPAPQSIADSLKGLSAAAASLQVLKQEAELGTESSPDLRLELYALRQELHAVHRLIDHGVRLNGEWGMILASLLNNNACNYTAEGVEVSLPGERHLSVTG